MSEKLDSNNDQITEPDNSKLEELMEIEPSKMTLEIQQEFLKLLKESTLIIPVEITTEIIEKEDIDVGGIIQTKLPPKTNFVYITKNTGEKSIVAFTRGEIIDKIGLKSSRIIMNMRDLANVLRNAGDYFSSIMINPQTEHSIEINLPGFIGLFNDGENVENPFISSLRNTLYMFATNSIELEEHHMFFLRSEYEIMENESVDGIYTNKMPLAVSSNESFQEQLPILHKIMLVQGQKILYTGKKDEGPSMDVLIAPGSQFQKFYDEDGDTSVWRCIKQPFYEE